MPARKRGRPRNSSYPGRRRADYIIARVINAMLREGYALRSPPHQTNRIGIYEAVAEAARNELGCTDHTGKRALGPDRIEQIHEASGFKRPAKSYPKQLSRRRMALIRARYGYLRIFQTEFDDLDPDTIAKVYKASRLESPTNRVRGRTAKERAIDLMRRYRNFVHRNAWVDMTINELDAEVVMGDLAALSGDFPISTDSTNLRLGMWVSALRN